MVCALILYSFLRIFVKLIAFLLRDVSIEEENAFLFRKTELQPFRKNVKVATFSRSIIFATIYSKDMETISSFAYITINFKIHSKVYSIHPYIYIYLLLYYLTFLISDLYKLCKNQS